MTKMETLMESVIGFAERAVPDGHSFVVQVWRGGGHWYACVAYRNAQGWQEEIGEGEGLSLLRALESLEGKLEDAAVERRDELAS